MARIELIEKGNFEAFTKMMITPDCKLRDKITEFFTTVDTEIYELMSSIGSKTISDILLMKIGWNYREIMGIDADIKEMVQYVQDNKKMMTLNEFMIKLHNSSVLIDILEKHFVPVEIDCGITNILIIKKRRY